jgi:AhpD family alkylhydroperoxidase
MVRHCIGARRKRATNRYPENSRNWLFQNATRKPNLSHVAPAGASTENEEETMETRLDFYKANPQAIKALLAVEERIGKSGIEKSLAELVRLRASQINGCAFCVDMHTTDARKGGETERRLATVVVWRETPFFTERERAALEWTEAVTLVSEAHVPNAVWEAVKPHFSDEELVDLTLLITAINSWNRFAIAFRKMPA